MALIRPRLTDFYGIPIAQEGCGFAIPFLDEDIPLNVDPFLLWKSTSQQDHALHTLLISTFNGLAKHQDKSVATEILQNISECDEVGLGVSKTGKGVRVGASTAKDILAAFDEIPSIQSKGLSHIEEIQLFVDHISKDRISDFTCNILKSHLIDYSIQQSKNLGIPLHNQPIKFLDPKSLKMVTETVEVPRNEHTGLPLLLVPKHWLRYSPWINFEEFFKDYALPDDKLPRGRVEILSYNRHNYGLPQMYLLAKERAQADCKIDPLFVQIPILSAKRKFAEIKKTASGKDDNNDKRYEDSVCQLFASLMYPDLDFAQEQVRTESGRHIRDLIFYNTCRNQFLTDIRKDYDAQQIVFELKNVATIDRDHINQLNRYMTDHFGRFGIIVTRNAPSRSMFQNTIDLWSSQRKCVLIIDDTDVETMVTVFESKQRLPIEVINHKYREFQRACPS